MVEAVTIVLAMGLTRGWRSAFWGTVLALFALASITIVAGYALTEWFPESLLQFIIGTLLLIFGLQWLRKAILRSSGLKAVPRRGVDLPGGARSRPRRRNRTQARP
jgi:uncharacterized membrane protein